MLDQRFCLTNMFIFSKKMDMHCKYKNNIPYNKENFDII